MAQGNQVIDVIIVTAFDDDIDDFIEYRTFLHGRLCRCSLDIALDFFGYLGQAIHVEDLLPDLLLVFLDPSISVYLLGIKVRHDLHSPFSKDITLENIAQGSLGVDGENQHPMSLLGEIIGCGRGKGGLAQTPLSSKHNVPTVGMLGEYICD